MNKTSFGIYANQTDKRWNTFIEEMKSGMRVRTSFGNGIIENIIEDIHCSVNVLLDNGDRKNIMLYNFTDNGLKLNLDYE